MNQRGCDQMGRVMVQVELGNHRDKVLAEAGSLPADQVRHVRMDAVVDSGASYLVVPKSVAAHLGVPVAEKATVRYADGRKAKRPVVTDVDVELLGREGTFKAIVEPKRTDILIGAIVLEDLDLLVDCRTQTLRPRDPSGIITEVE